MVSKFKNNRNAAICARVNELRDSNKPIMQTYSEVGEEFGLTEDTVFRIFRKIGYYK